MRKKIVFIQPPVSLEEVYGGLSKVSAVSPPLNLLLLAAIVRDHGYDPYVIDCPARKCGYTDTLKLVDAIRPDYVCITAMTPHIMQAGRLAEILKEASPHTPTILGGAHVSVAPLETLEKFPSIDIGVIGEGDYTLPRLLKTIEEKKEPADVGGIVFRTGSKLVRTDEINEKVNLDGLPIYAWDILEGFPDIYESPLFSTHNKPSTPIITSRGCPAQCIFCYSGCHKTLSTYSAEYIIRMLKRLQQEYGIREVMIYDDNFVMFKKNLLRLLNGMIEEKLGLTWSCNTRVDLVDEEILKLMAKAGCWQIGYGIESGNQQIINGLRKKITKERVRQVINSTREAKIHTVGYFMIGHFGETEETIKETMNFAVETGLDEFRCSFFTPLPGTEAIKVAKQHGEFDPDNWGQMTLFQPTFIPFGMTRDDLIRWQKWMLRKFYFRPGPILSYLKMTKKHPLAALKGAWAIGTHLWK